MMTVFEEFRESLYDENRRAAFELEAVTYGIMARLGLSEPDALELACKIVASDKAATREQNVHNEAVCKQAEI